MTMLLPKREIVRDRKWLDHVRTLPCLLTGSMGNEYMGIDPHHLMTGRGSLSMKSSDDLVIPLRHDLHAMIGTKEFPTEAHLIGRLQNRDLLMTLVKAYAREQYRNWKR